MDVIKQVVMSKTAKMWLEDGVLRAEVSLGTEDTLETAQDNIRV